MALAVERRTRMGSCVHGRWYEMLKLIRTLLAHGLLCSAIVAALASGSLAKGAIGCATPALAFRFDDIQDHWLSNAQKAVIELFAQHDLPLTLGIIGGFFGEDRSLVETIKLHKARVEIANHGLYAKNDGGGKSILLSQSSNQTREQIEQSNNKIEALLGVKPDLYIPHKNQFNDDVLQALELLDFHYISSACSRHIVKPITCEDDCGYLDEGICTAPDLHGLIHLPVGASTQWEPTPGKGSASPEKVLDEIRRSTDRYGFAVVMLHPQDFVGPNKSLDAHSLGALSELLSQVRDADRHKVVTLSQVSGSCDP